MLKIKLTDGCLCLFSVTPEAQPKEQKPAKNLCKNYGNPVGQTSTASTTSHNTATRTDNLTTVLPHDKNSLAHKFCTTFLPAKTDESNNFYTQSPALTTITTIYI